MTTVPQREAKLAEIIDPRTMSHSQWLMDLRNNDGVFSDDDARRMLEVAVLLKYRPDLDMKGDFQFEVGKTYPTRGGRLVTIVRKTDTKGYECVQGDDMSPRSGYRYSRSDSTSDHGRCTGSETGDFCLLPIEITDERITGAKTHEERRLLVCSTAHLTLTTVKWLEDTPNKDWPFAGGTYGEYGFFVYALDNEDLHPIRQSHRVPHELETVMTWARRHGFTNILFDRDADRIEGLTTWEW